MGAAVHADDLRTTAPSVDSLSKLMTASVSCLKLNGAKSEIVKVSPNAHTSTVVKTGNSAKCLDVWWNSSLSAKHSVTENINKARRAFFAFGRLGAFRGDLNPL